MRKIFFFSLSLASLLLLSCGKDKPSVAEQREARQQHNLQELERQQRSLAYCDSMVQVLQSQVQELMPLFKYEKQDQYEDHGRYVHRLLQTGSNASRNYLQAYSTDAFRLILKGYYVGERPMHLQAIELQADSLTQRFAGSAHPFSVEDVVPGYSPTTLHYEIITLDEQSATDLLKLIDAYSASRERISLVGKKSSARFYLSDNDKKALIETYRLATLMKDIHRLEQQADQASLQIQKYQNRLAK